MTLISFRHFAKITLLFLCNFLATLDLPPCIGMDVPPLGLVEQIEPPALQAAPVIACLSPASERGPPTA